MRVRILLVGVLILLSVACATVDDISGSWRITRTDGANQTAKWVQLDRHTFYLFGEGLDIAGKYRRERDALKLIAADNPRMQPVTVRVNADGTMTVVEAPALSRADVNFLAATLVAIRQ